MKNTSILSKKNFKVKKTARITKKIKLYTIFFLITMILNLKIIVEIIMFEQYNTKNYIFIILLFTSQITFSLLLFYLDNYFEKNQKVKTYFKSCLIFSSILCQNFCLLFFRVFAENITEHNRFTQMYWESQGITFFSMIFMKYLCFKQKTLIFILINTMAIILFHYYSTDANAICLSFLNFIPNSIMFYFIFRDYKNYDQKETGFCEPNIEEICDFLFQGFVILTQDSHEILYVSPKFSNSVSKLKKIRNIDDINGCLHDFEEQKIIVNSSRDQDSIMASLKKYSNSYSNIESKYKTKTILLNSSKTTKTRLKYQQLTDILESNDENFELFLNKNVVRTYLVFNSAKEKKELHIKNVIYKKMNCYCLFIDSFEKVNILSNLSKENEFQSRLLSSFSHEMRTPLNGSIPMLQDVLENIKPCCEALLKDNIFTALGSLKLLENTINDIIDFQALYSGEFYLNIQEINIKDVFENVIQLMKVQAEKKGLEFITKIDDKIPSLIMSDSNRIQQLLVNLLSNAIKFTVKGYVEICAKIKMSTPELLIQIEIKDSGIGIEEEKLLKMKKILNEFEIEKMQFLETTGCSFGMILSQNLAMALGTEGYGGLNVETKLNEGSSFIFYIVDRIDQRDLNYLPDLHESRNCSLSIVCQSMDKIEKIEKSSNQEKNLEKTIENSSIPRKSIQLSSASPQLKKLRETTYSRIKSDIFAMPEEFSVSNEDFQDTPHHYLSQKIMFLKETYHKMYHPPLTSSSPTVKTGTQKIITENTNNPTTIMTQFSSHECICNKILVVDDCIFNIKTMELLLKKEGLKCDSAFDGYEAIEKFKNKFIFKTTCCGPKCVGYRLIFMDFQMPKKDGVQATIELQSLIREYKLHDIPIICCTAFDSNSMVKKCFQAGMKEAIFKPINNTVLKNALRKWLR